MDIYINGEKITLLTVLSVAQLIEQQSLNPQGLAIAINQNILPRSEWESYQLKDNDSLTVFRAIAGG
ncbi:sulfur carrier protein ThiS [Otariodibacter oris]|uniref:Sulfur carrier protein ThiS n=1 Tax=Otariodibacter oris TaxID=1032623 RepID=A0A420XGN0_9PAST|nr:sulfur carrier protein ThiS [Otariodibacter oris]QGM79942.1 thiamine biosynthesis protein ThiS [Otariodibacter oris]RKR71763.1 sulfur carrier protein ThiS [Otariodibacter oris]